MALQAVKIKGTSPVVVSINLRYRNLMSNLLSHIEARLIEAFKPTALRIEDESHLHAGHGGSSEHAAEFGADAPSHIHIDISAPAFAEMSRLARHRAVMSAMGDAVPKLHAIRLTAR
jgi:BolA protein